MAVYLYRSSLGARFSAALSVCLLTLLPTAAHAHRSQVGANREAEIFPNPNEVDINRNIDSYVHYGVGPQTYVGKEASRVALTAMLKVVGRLDNLRRAPGAQGQYIPLIPYLVESGHKMYEGVN